MIEFRPYNSETYSDACKVVSGVFSPAACEIIKYGITNPALLEWAGSDAGDVAYLDGVPVGFEGSFPRKMYYKQEPFWTVCGSTLCVLPEARNKGIAMRLFSRHIKPRNGSLLVFGNSSNPDSVELHRFFKVNGAGPHSWDESRSVIVNSVRRYVNALLKKLHIKRHVTWTAYGVSGSIVCGWYELRTLAGFGTGELDDFWKSYLSHNCGFVLSRTPNELEWVYGQTLTKGKGLLLGLYEKSDLVGYCVLKCSGEGDSWTISDMLVMHNSPLLLHNLVRLSLKFLRKHTPAIYCSILGFSTHAHKVMDELFPIVRKMRCNSFTWNVQKQSQYQPKMDDLDAADSWFFGPYDGDWCLL